MGIFGRDTASAGREPVETTLGASTTIQGTLRSDGGVRVNGTFQGNMEVAGNIVIGEGGQVIGDITARNVTVGGVVNGNIHTSEQLAILASGQVIGDVAAMSLDVAPGGIHQGYTRMTGFEQRALAAPQDAQPASGGSGQPAAPPTSTSTGTPKAGPKTDLDTDTVDVTARPAGRRDSRVREHEVAMPDLDLSAVDIEPIIPDIVIEDVPSGTAPASSGAPNNQRRR